MYFYPIDGWSLLFILFIILVGYVLHKYLPQVLLVVMLFAFMYAVDLLAKTIGIFGTGVLLCILLILFCRFIFREHRKQLEKEKRKKAREEQMLADTSTPNETNDTKQDEPRSELPQRIKKVYPSTDEDVRNRE
ncbi:MAG: hypothetical protein IJ692_05570 [Alloprevotella sp.]|nr:hypothetical protein [Alloprevotella sp.]